MPRIYLPLLPLIISSAVLTAGSFAQNANNYGLSGYDLEKGPVFYEHGSEGAESYREKRFFDRGAVVEKSYQLPVNGFDQPYTADRRNADSTSSGNGPYYDGRAANNFQVPRGRNYWSEQRARPDQRGENAGPLNVEENSRSAEFRVPGPLDYPVQLNRLAASSFDDYGPRIHLAAARSENHLALPMKAPPSTFGRLFPENEGVARYAESFPAESRRPAAGPTFYGESLPEVEGRRVEPFGETRETRAGLSRSGISTSRLENSDRIAGGPIPRDLEGHPAPVDYWNSQIHLRDGQGTLRTYRDRMDSLDRQPSPSEDRYSFGENIFEPRAQIINYVFSKNRSKPSASELTAEEGTRDQLTDYAAPGEEKNRLREEFGKVNSKSKDVAEVTSIQISEIPRHKTRHHHGEGLKRDYANRRRS